MKRERNEKSNRSLVVTMTDAVACWKAYVSVTASGRGAYGAECATLREYGMTDMVETHFVEATEVRVTAPLSRCNLPSTHSFFCFLVCVILNEQRMRETTFCPRSATVRRRAFAHASPSLRVHVLPPRRKPSRPRTSLDCAPRSIAAAGVASLSITTTTRGNGSTQQCQKPSG